jgi:Protein of unknown function (DUF2380)
LFNDAEDAMLRFQAVLPALFLFFLASLSSPSSAAGKCVAVFDFELIDMSLDGQINGRKDKEKQRLVQLTQQLRKWVGGEAGLLSCDMAPVEAESQASNLFACGCIQRLARSVDAKLAVAGSVHKLSNLILNIQVNVFDVNTDKLVAQLNADIRSNTDSSWARGLDWLIQHRLGGAMAVLAGGNQ